MPRREASEGTDPADTLVLDPQPPECGKTGIRATRPMCCYGSRRELAPDASVSKPRHVPAASQAIL